MAITVKEIEEALFKWAPRSLAEEWDNVGLQCGNPEADVETIAICLDITPASLSFALENGADLVISHHPLIFKPLSCLNLKNYTARLLAGFLRHEISVISMHTNLDSCTGGVNDRLCDLLEITDRHPLVPSKGIPGVGLGRTGRLKKSMAQEEFLEYVRERLSLKCLPYAGRVSMSIRSVSVCSGSGSSLFDYALAEGVQAFVTAEIKHSVARKAEAEGVLLLDAGHFETEQPVVASISGFLTETGKAEGWNITVAVFDDERPPTYFYQTVSRKETISDKR